VRIAERFAFVTGEEINLPVNKAVPENTKKYLQTLLAFLTVFLFILKQSLSTQARCELVSAISFTLFSSLSIKL